MNKVVMEEEMEVEKVFSPRTGEEVPTHQFAVRLTKKEQIRYAKILAIAFSRNAYADKADVNRVLMGLQTDQNLITQAEIEYFRGAPEPPTLLANVPESSQPIKEAKVNHAVARKRPKGKERRS